MKKTAKNEPLVIALSRSERQVLAMTASLFDTDLAGYVKQLIRNQVREIRRQSPTLTLSQRTFRAFVKMCERPTRPNAALRRAVQRHRHFTQA